MHIKILLGINFPSSLSKIDKAIAFLKISTYTVYELFSWITPKLWQLQHTVFGNDPIKKYNHASGH